MTMASEVFTAREGGLSAANAIGRAAAVQMRAGATEKGYTPEMLRNILSIEKEYRNNEDETMNVFSADGELVKQRHGKGNSVRVYPKDVPKDAVLTHNHPMSIGKSGAEAIGHSFTWDDIKLAISTDAKEIRAVTPTYTYSLKRPAGGWGVKTGQFTKDYWNTYNDRLDNETYPYATRRNTDTAWARADVVHFHAVVRELAKRYGWDYTKKRG